MIGRTLARAKLNLALHVTGQRADGYHTLHSLVAFADFGDDISVAQSDRDSLTATGPFGGDVPDLDGNLLGKALRIVRSWGKDDLANEPVAIKLSKNLPVASGIGGGSADAAALVTLLTGGRPLTETEKVDVLALGADVPMCLDGQSSLISGIGEEITPVTVPSAALVLVNPGVAVSTPDVFRALTNRHNPSLPVWNEPDDIGQLISYLQETRNDLMEPALRLVPAVQQCLDALSSAPFARMSGSGATCFALLRTSNEAELLAADIKKAHPDWWVRSGQISNATD